MGLEARAKAFFSPLQRYRIQHLRSFAKYQGVRVGSSARSLRPNGYCVAEDGSQ